MLGSVSGAGVMTGANFFIEPTRVESVLPSVLRKLAAELILCLTLCSELTSTLRELFENCGSLGVSDLLGRPGRSVVSWARGLRTLPLVLLRSLYVVVVFDRFKLVFGTTESVD